MELIQESEQFFEIQSTLPTGRRVLFGLFALFPLLAPYQLLIKTEWNRYFSLFFLLAVLISLGAVVVSGLLVWAAVAGLSITLRFDNTAQTFTYSEGAAAVRWRSVSHPLKEIAEITITEQEWSDGPSAYAAAVRLHDGKTYQTNFFPNRENIDTIVQEANRLLRRNQHNIR